MKTLIRNGRVAFTDHIEESDVLLEGGLISAIGQNLGTADRVVDATGCYVFIYRGKQLFRPGTIHG